MYVDDRSRLVGWMKLGEALFVARASAAARLCRGFAKYWMCAWGFVRSMAQAPAGKIIELGNGSHAGHVAGAAGHFLHLISTTGANSS